MLPNNEWAPNKTKEDTKNCPEKNKNENTKNQNLWDTVKEVLRRKFIEYRPASRS